VKTEFAKYGRRVTFERPPYWIDSTDPSNYGFGFTLSDIFHVGVFLGNRRYTFDTEYADEFFDYLHVKYPDLYRFVLKLSRDLEKVLRKVGYRNVATMEVPKRLHDTGF